MSVACCTSARNRASLSASTTRALFDSSTIRAMRHATADRGDAGDDGEDEGGARPGVVEEHDAGHREQRGAEHDHAGASVPDELDIAALPERAHRRVHDRGGEEQVRDRPERVEDPTVGVGAVGDEPRVHGVGDQHECQPREEQPRGGGPPGQREHRVHDDDDEQDVHQRIRTVTNRSSCGPEELSNTGVTTHCQMTADSVDRDHRAVDQGGPVEARRGRGGRARSRGPGTRAGRGCRRTGSRRARPKPRRATSNATSPAAYSASPRAKSCHTPASTGFVAQQPVDRGARGD